MPHIEGHTEEEQNFQSSDANAQEQGEFLYQERFILPIIENPKILLQKRLLAANEIIGMNAAGNLLEYKTLTAGTNITITHAANNITISAASGISGLSTNGAVYAASATTIASTAALTNGQLLVGSTSAAPVAATLTGTSGKVSVSNGAGTITLSVPSPFTPGNIDATAIGLNGIAQAFSQALRIKVDDDAVDVTIQSVASSANVTASDVFIDFRSDDGTIGGVTGTAVSGVIAYNTFTGSHWSQSKSIIAIPRTVIKKRKKGKKEYEEEITKWDCDLIVGSVLVSTDEMCQWQAIKQEEEWTEIEGKKRLKMKNIDRGYQDVNNTLPMCEVSEKAEDKRVYGVYGGHDKDGDILVLALGSGVIVVCDEGGAIEVGDFLCSSSQKGIAKRYDGQDMRLVVAKARQSFNGQTGTIACTLMAG